MFRKSFETSLIISLKKDNLAYLAVLRETFLIGKYSNFNFKKKTSKSRYVGGTFFETTSEAKCPEKPLANPEKPLANPEKPLANAEKPLANSEKPLANECGRRVYLTTTPLPYQPPAEPVVMTSLPPYLLSEKVSLIFFQIYRYGVYVRKIFPYLEKKIGKKVKMEKNPTSSFKIGGILEKKNQNPNK